MLGLLLLSGGLTLQGAVIGEPAPELVSGPMLKGGKLRLADQRGKKFTVLHFWKTRCPACVKAVPMIRELAVKYAGQGEFAAVGCEFPGILRQEESWKNYPGTVISDPMQENFRQYFPQNGTFPADVIISSGGTLLWKGPTIALAGVLEEIRSGKYDLKSAAEVDRFNTGMTKALADKDTQGALKLLRERRKLFPEDPALAEGEARILAGPGKAPDAGLKVLDAALTKAPKSIRLYLAKVQILQSSGRGDSREVLDVYRAIAREFSRQSVLLAKLTGPLLKNPRGSFVLLSAYILAHQAYRNRSGLTALECGRIAANLARVYYYLGMTDRAVLMQAEAVERLKNSPAARAATAELAFYRGSIAAAAEVRKLEAAPVKK